MELRRPIQVARRLALWAGGRILGLASTQIHLWVRLSHGMRRGKPKTLCMSRPLSPALLHSWREENFAVTNQCLLIRVPLRYCRESENGLVPLNLILLFGETILVVEDDVLHDAPSF